MFLAHFANTDIDTLLTWPCSKISFWYEKALAVHNRLNSEKKDNNNGSEK